MSTAFIDVPEVWAVIAGNYALCGAGEAQGVSYEVWALPSWTGEGGELLAWLPDGIGFLAHYLGSLPHCRVTIVQLSEQFASGQTFSWKIPDPTIAFGMGQTRWTASQVCIEQLWEHELAHALTDVGILEQLATFISDLYVRECRPELADQAFRRRRDYFLSAVSRFGPRPTEAAARAGVGDAYSYSRGALVFNMFGGLFGDEATKTLLRGLNTPGLKYDTKAGPRAPGWLVTMRAAAKLAAGEEGAQFLQTWLDLKAAPQLDYAIQDVVADPETGTLKFVISDLSSNGLARRTVPEVDVEVRVEGAQGVTESMVTRVAVTGAATTVTLQTSGRPVSVRLDPNDWLLDYDPENNWMAVGQPRSPFAGVSPLVVAAFGVVAGAAAWLWLRRKPVRQAAPPSGAPPRGSQLADEWASRQGEASTGGARVPWRAGESRSVRQDTDWASRESGGSEQATRRAEHRPSGEPGGDRRELPSRWPVDGAGRPVGLGAELWRIGLKRSRLPKGPSFVVPKEVEREEESSS